jgi:hypothetical protein
MSKKLFFFGVAALLSVSLFVFGCSIELDGDGVWSVLTPAQQLAADLNAAAGGGNKASVDDDGITVTLGDDVSISTSITVPVGVTLVVAAEKTLTVGLGGSIVLTGDSSTPASLVLAAKANPLAASGGGGKLVLVGVTGAKLGSNGDISVNTGRVHLLTVGSTSGGVFTFTGAAAELGSAGITGIGTTPKAFNSIIAATTKNALAQGKVIFKAADSGTATIDKETKVKSKT